MHSKHAGGGLSIKKIEQWSEAQGCQAISAVAVVCTELEEEAKSLREEWEN